DVHVAAQIGTQHRHTPAAQAELVARLRTGRHRHARAAALDGRHLDRAAKRRGRHRDRHAAEDVGTVALKDRMRRDADEDVEIAGSGAARPGFALAGEADARAVLDTRWDADRQGFFATYAALPAAGFARLVDRLTRALAGRAGLLEREESLLPPHAAVAMTSAAARGSRAGFGAAPFAAITMDKGRDTDRRLLAAERLFQ